ncbi:putative MerR family transcriptional regulator [Streptomyces sp. NBRC 110611]|uniref:MerR family transcriptional regulator n=1 Tax=Streptomyces sp. NBRC 110611 TaxID=1621259 RepID=UPI0008305C08|nr:MerR family transcriptional regulator [Streptomyces sp. NBRC 110611]GAU69852.1 putative MerR family transcriptional regulator [Streptomyces sp. NBRC 110611]
MDDDALLSIGELARLTGLTVKTIRFWSDAGVVPPTDRTPAGYRLYGPEAQARLGLVRTLRGLGIDIATIQQVLGREVTVAEVAAAHVEALEVQIRTLRLRQAVLRAVAGHGSTPEEMELMHRLARLSDQERRRLVHDFIDHTFGGLELDAEFLTMMRTAMPELPDDPTPEQLSAWVELAELVQDDGFRARMRRAAADQVQARADAGPFDDDAARRLAELIRERTATARDAGVEPGSEAAREIVDRIVGACARLVGREDGSEFRTWLLERLEIGQESGYERYWQLIAVINGQLADPANPADLVDPADPGMGPAVAWLLAGVRAGRNQK